MMCCVSCNVPLPFSDHRGQGGRKQSDTWGKHIHAGPKRATKRNRKVMRNRPNQPGPLTPSEKLQALKGRKITPNFYLFLVFSHPCEGESRPIYGWPLCSLIGVDARGSKALTCRFPPEGCDAWPMPSPTPTRPSVSRPTEGAGDSSEHILCKKACRMRCSCFAKTFSSKSACCWRGSGFDSHRPSSARLPPPSPALPPPLRRVVFVVVLVIAPSGYSLSPSPTKPRPSPG